MAEGIVQEYARRLLATGKDIARDLRGVGVEGAATPNRQRMRYSPENVDATRNYSARMEFSDGSPIPGVSRADSSRLASDFADQYFNNLPLLLERDAQGNSIPVSEVNPRPTYIFMGEESDGILNGGMHGSRLELLAGEMLALSQKAAEGLASPEELELLDTYQQFMTSRTGV